MQLTDTVRRVLETSSTSWAAILVIETYFRNRLVPQFLSYRRPSLENTVVRENGVPYLVISGALAFRISGESEIQRNSPF